MIISTLILMQSCELPLMKSGEFDGEGIYTLKYTFYDYLASNQEKEMETFFKAIKHAGLENRVKNSATETWILPTNSAFEQLMGSIGYTQIEQFDPSVLRYLLEYLILPDKYVSSAMELDNINEIITANGKKLYFTRKNIDSDRYALFINSYLPEDINEDFNSIQTKVIKQDYQFKDNRVIHIVNSFPYYALKLETSDSFTGTPLTDKQATLNVNIDTYIYKFADNKRYYGDLLSNGDRIPVLWYENKTIDFAQEITSAKLNLYVRANTAMETCDFNIHDISQEIWTLTAQGTNRAQLENAWGTPDGKTGTYTPTRTAANTIGSFAQAENSRWIQVDITTFINKHYRSESSIPIAFCLYPQVAFPESKGRLSFGYKKETDAANSINPSYISMIGPAKSIIEEVNSTDFSCPKEEAAAITSSNLLYKWPETPVEGFMFKSNNIIYTVSDVSGGVITRNGIPIVVNGTFLQSDIDAGAISFVHTASSTSNGFVELMPGDYSGGKLEKSIRLNVTFN